MIIEDDLTQKRKVREEAMLQLCDSLCLCERKLKLKINILLTLNLTTMKRIFTLLLSFLAMTSFAQNEMKELKARLVDEEKKPVQFANISLKMADNDSIIAGTSSD